MSRSDNSQRLFQPFLIVQWNIRQWNMRLWSCLSTCIGSVSWLKNKPLVCYTTEISWVNLSLPCNIVYHMGTVFFMCLCFHIFIKLWSYLWLLIYVLFLLPLQILLFGCFLFSLMIYENLLSIVSYMYSRYFRPIFWVFFILNRVSFNVWKLFISMDSDSSVLGLCAFLHLV